MKLKRILTAIASSLLLISVSATFADMHTSGNGMNGGDQKFSPKQVKSIQKIIHSYLVNNPEVLLQASIALRKKNAKRARKPGNVSY